MGAPYPSTTRRRAVTRRHARVTLAPTVPTSPINRAGSLIAVGEDRRSPTPKTRRGGRPSRTDALRLGERILEVATELFLAEGYGTTTIEAVAARAGISKRTFYHRFDDKAALFAAVVHRIIEQLRPPPGVPIVEGATLHDVLRRIAGLILRAALSPRALALHRLVTAESARFPKLVRLVDTESVTQEAKALIGNLLARELQDPRFSVEARAFAAEQFLVMVVTAPQRRAMGLGPPLTSSELDAWTDDVVRLFLNGCRGWAAAASRKK
jgi:TetR/AcrR family transcriptional repressor of mexJK operon